LAFLCLLISGQVSALGLGEITLKSALNQKLDAEIELIDARGLDAAEIIAQLGTAEDFQRVGVERFFFLTDLRFSVEGRTDGRRVLKVTSAQPVTEPFVNFLVQVMWPSGRLLKEYTLLLDPPAFTQQAAAPVVAPGRTDPGGGPAGRVDREGARRDSQVSFTTPPAASSTSAPSRDPDSRLSGDTFGTTDRNDTLWAIASRARRGDASVHQTMLAIARLNPEAFIGGNINLLKAGYVLRLPDENEAQAVDRAEAIAAVAEHNLAWQAYREGGALLAAPSAAAPGDGSLAAQVDATARASRAPQPAAPAQEGELRILADETKGDAATAGGGSGSADALAAQLAAAEEEKDRISRERDEALQQRDQVAASAEEVERQVQLRDQQIAQLQAQLKAANEGAGEPAQGPVPAKAADGGFVDLLKSPVVLIGGGLLAMLALAGGLVALRRRRAPIQDELPPLTTTARRSAGVAANAATAVRDEPVVRAEAVAEAPDEVEEEAHAATSAREHEDTGGPQTSDVIGEADIYIAYGRYPQAVNLLHGALEEDPNRSDVRLKLLEVYAETRDRDNFAAQMVEFVDRCDDNDMLLEARELEAKLREGAELDIGEQDLASQPDRETARAAQPEEEFDLDFDAGEPAIELEPAPAEVKPQRTGSDDLGGDLGIDFDPDRDAARREGAAQVAVSDGDEELAADGEPDFDLEDLEFAEQPAPRKSASAGEAADDAFDFLGEEDTASTKLDLARAYIDMGDDDGAKEILAEVAMEGSAEQRRMAGELLAKLS
jgi:pilus assembly protein FimV